MIKKIPTIISERIILRPLTINDAKLVQKLAGEKEVAEPTLNIPHPYPDGAAEDWIKTHKPEAEKGNQYVFAIQHKQDTQLLGAIGIIINKPHNNAEVGYWIGKPYWNFGFASEALQQVLEFGFIKLELNKIHAHHMTFNQASGKVMIKNGMTKEGTFKKHIYKNDVYHDIDFYGILKEDYKKK